VHRPHLNRVFAAAADDANAHVIENILKYVAPKLGWR
jgi:hypothetical protein